MNGGEFILSKNGYRQIRIYLSLFSQTVVDNSISGGIVLNIITTYRPTE